MSRGFFGLIYARRTESSAAVWSEKIRGVIPRADGMSECTLLVQIGAEVLRGARKSAIMADSREVMNIRQASHYLGVSPDTLYKYVGEQKIPAFKLGNRWRFKKSRLDQWMEEKSSQMEVGMKKQRAAKAAGTQ